MSARTALAVTSAARHGEADMEAEVPSPVPPPVFRDALTQPFPAVPSTAASDTQEFLAKLDTVFSQPAPVHESGRLGSVLMTWAIGLAGLAVLAVGAIIVLAAGF